MLDEKAKDLPEENSTGNKNEKPKENEVKPADREADKKEKVEQKDDSIVAEAKEEPEVKVEPEVKDEPVAKDEPEVKEEPETKVEAEGKDKPVAKEEPEASEELETKVESEATEVPVEKEAIESDTSKPEEPSEHGEKKGEEQKLKIEVPLIQFAKLSLEDLVKTLEEFLREYDIRDIKGQIEELKQNFLKKFKSLINEKREEFVKAGGEASEFFYASPVKTKFDTLIREYKRKRQQFYKDIEREQKENLEMRLKLIDELKDLIDTADPSTMYKSFKDLQERWRSVGQIPRSKYNDVWRTYHHHVERFYDLLHLNNDFRDLDFKHNLEEKTKLVEKAEELAEDEDVNHAFKELQILHRLWKEEIGPVAREYREDIWGRFSEATKKIHKKRHELQDKLEEKYKQNVVLKLAVIDKIRSIDLEGVNNHKLWQEQIRKLEALREEFFAIGKIPRAKSDEVWQLFRQATREFNAAKNSFYKGLKKDQSENLKKKLELVRKAEELKDSEDWDEVTETFKKIQAEWKTIGHVPRKDSDRIWKQFKSACNHYFDRLHGKRSDISKDQSQLIDDKKKMLEELKTFMDSKELSVEKIDERIRQWRSMGALPAKVRHLESKFGKLLDAAYRKLGIEKEDAEFMKFKNLMDGYAEQKNSRKLDSEQLFIRKRVDEITREIKQLENNISFISNASDDNPLVKNVYRNIEGHKKDLEFWKRKLDYLSKLDY